MDTTQLKKFAQFTRRSLMEQISAKLKLVLAADSAARREKPETVKKLDEAIKQEGQAQVIERVAYIWFNRFCALRFMDMNRYTRIGVVSPAEGQFQPEILAEAKMGHIDEDMVPEAVRQQIFALLDGSTPSLDGQAEAYRLLLVAACNHWNQSMPFLFQRIDDYTELLMPGDLLSGNSILAYTREAMTPDACEDVEVIGWLYQFYISEKKDQVFADLKKNKKVTPENIPAATQLFTPNWIVRYLVENSLGRLWMLNRPNSGLVEQMEYYIKPEEPEADFLRIDSPEEIKICDPACGSGHMLTYAFDLLYAIYEEEGYEASEIPEKILTHNLFGIEIDERAGELAAFALSMKARAKQRRFFNRNIKPNICVLENIQFDADELTEYMDFVGRDLFTEPLQKTLCQFEEADNFGSLIRPKLTNVDDVLEIIESKDVAGNLFLNHTNQKVLRILQQADYLGPKYHVVIANPPYMGGKGMNGRLADWSKKHYPASKADLFAMFIERGTMLVPKLGYSAMVTMQSWMFLSSYELLRKKIMAKTNIVSMVHMANMVMGIAFGTSGTIWQVGHKNNAQGGYCYVEYDDLDENNKPAQFPPHNKRNEVAKDTGWIFHVFNRDFTSIPGNPIAYWISKKSLSTYKKSLLLNSYFDVKQGLATADDNRFLRIWSEISSHSFSKFGGEKWHPFQKGGSFRKWFGNHEVVINWEEDGSELRDFDRSVIRNPDFYFREGVTWSIISSGAPSFRYFGNDFVFGHVGPALFPTSMYSTEQILGFLNSRVSSHFLSVISETFKYEVGHLTKLPIIEIFPDPVEINKIVEFFKSDWNSQETSWSFIAPPLITSKTYCDKVEKIYTQLADHWRAKTFEMQRLEEANNRIFIEAYGLQDELAPEVPLSEITLTCNPHYRYGGNKTEEELEALLLADTMRELVSYAVGCMFGRYALEKPGLILANQGEGFADYLKQIPQPSFPADDDNVIPMLDGDWFVDNIVERFRKFLRVAFGEEHYEDNLRFIEQALNVKNKRNYSLSDYFLGEFYNDHVKRYKKRPIYWLFSSPKGSFNALIYMHRYRPDTVSVVLNDYLREYQTKLESHKSHLEALSISANSSQADKTKALKEIDKINKILLELEEYERDVLYPLATQQVAIDLDDGVKANYPKFGAALKKIVGLDAKDD